MKLEDRVIALEQEVEHVRQHAKETGTPARERNELRRNLRTADAERDSLKAAIKDLEAELETAVQAKTTGTPARERTELRQKLRESESKAMRLQERIETLEDELASAEEEKAAASDRKDLHDLVKKTTIQAEQLQIEAADRERKLVSSMRKEGELRVQLQTAQADLGDLQAQVAEFETRVLSSRHKEKELRAQLKDLKEAKVQLEDLEVQVGERKTSSSGHARREAELRTQLRDAKVEVEQLSIEAADKDDQIARAVKKEQQLRDRLRKNTSADTVQIDLQQQVADAELDLQAFQQQVQDRDAKLQTSIKREQELRRKLQTLQQAVESDRTLDEKQFGKDMAVTQHRHQAELKGLAKQIQFLRAKCTREEGFRNDLAYMKRFFLMQIKLYSDW